MIEFPFKKLLKRFNPEDERDPEKAAWDYGKKAREGLMSTGLVELFGIVVRKAERVRGAWDVWLESWEGLSGTINVGEKYKKLRDTWFTRRSDDE